MFYSLHVYIVQIFGRNYWASFHDKILGRIEIYFKVKFLPSEDLHKLYEQQSGEIAFILEDELRKRGISTNFKDLTCPYDQLFIDEAKLFDKVRSGRYHEMKDVIIPEMSSKFALEYLTFVLKRFGDGKNLDFKKMSTFMRKLMMNENDVCEC